MIGLPLAAGGVGAGLVVGGAFGARHAFEADHVAAVATLVEDRDRPAITGAAWGVGHSVPVVLLGVLFLALDLRVPDAVGTGFELVVAGVLVALGVRAIAGRESAGLALLRHVHDRDDGDGHRHLTLGGAQIGLVHTHADGESMAVGVVHGLAGSGGVVVAMAAAAPTVADGAAFLVGFSIASVVAMAAATWAWGGAVGRARRLRVIAGLASVAVGVLLFAEILGVGLPL